MADASRWLTALSSATSTRSRRHRRRRRGRRERARPAPAGRPSRASMSAFSARRSSSCLIGLIRCCATPSSRQRAEVAGPPVRGQHQDRGAAQAEARLQLAHQREAIHAGHVDVDQQDVEAAALLAGGLDRGAAPSSPSVGRRRPSTLHTRSTSARMRRFVSLSSTTSARRPATRSAAGRLRRHRRDGRLASASGKRRLKLNVLPTPCVLSTAIAPPISADDAGSRWRGRGPCRRTVATWCRPPGRTPRR